MRSKPRRKAKKILLIFVVLAVVFAGVFWWLKKDHDQPANNQNGSAGNSSQQAKSENLPVVDAQPTVDAWSDQQSGTASVVVYDLANNKTVASLNPNTQYFTASIYKLYVAYWGYQKVADGTYSLNDAYLSGYTRGACLDAMIRDSYSPCGEKMWAELGKDKLTAQLKNYGLKNTSMSGLYTSAADSALVLERLWDQTDLTQDHKNLYLDSMKTQPAKFRRGLPSGFTQSTVYDKVGWNENIEWHDTAIVTLPNNRSYVITVFTKNVGFNQIAQLGKALEAKLNQ
jgi:beta-lactamase class A